MLKKIIAFIGMLLFTQILFAQKEKLTGTVIDSITKTPLAFVSIVVAQNKMGATTSIDGNFSFPPQTGQITLVISYVGYITKTIIIDNTNTNKIVIKLQPQQNQLQTVVVGGGENPAHRIILLLQQNSKKNNPDFKSSFKYNAYTIAAIGGGMSLLNSQAKIDTSKKEKKIKPKAALTDKQKKADSLSAVILKSFKQNYLVVTESYTERIFKYPNKSKETIIATKISGFKTAPGAIVGGDFQPFGFYKDYLQMGDKSFVSPVINGSIKLYRFKLQETIVNQNDTTFIISFEPRKNKKINALKGLLYVNSDGYAIQNIQARAADEKGVAIRFNIQQKYERVIGQWFPVELNTSLYQMDIKKDSILAYWDSRSYISNAVIGLKIPNNTFSDVAQEFAPAAGKKTDTDWQKYRTDTLNEKEKNTYKNFDLLPKKTIGRMENVNKLVEVLALKAIPFGKIDLPLKYLLGGINRVENFRIGVGFQTNSLLNKFISVGAFGGYGIGDKAFKYGGNVSLNLYQRTATELKVSFAQDVAEPGSAPYFTQNNAVVSSQTIRKTMVSRIDSIKQFKINFTTKIFPALQTDVWLQNEKQSPSMYSYLFENSSTGFTKRQFTNTEIGLGFRYTKGEKIVRIGRAKFVSELPSTQFLLQYTKGLNNFLKGELSYNKLAIQFNHTFTSKWLGKTSIQFDAAKVWGNVPYYYLINSSASLNKNAFSLYVPNTFQVVGLYEFTSNQAVHFFMQHNFGNLLFKPKNILFRPEFVLVQAIGYGSLQNAQSHKQIILQAPEKGIFETGLLIKNLYRKKLRLLYVGIGGGVFYRYGYYHLPTISDNFSYKLGINFSF
jgi:hypothetical protein